MRAVLLAVLVVLACTLSVSASSADWSAPDALWSSDLSASELEARHSEFLMAASATGPSSSTAAPAPVASSTAPAKASSTGPAAVSSTAPARASSTAPAAVSSSTAPAGVPTKVADKPVKAKLAGTDQCETNPDLPICLYTPAKTAELGDSVSKNFGFPRADLPGEAFNAVYKTLDGTVVDSSTAAGRRLLASGEVEASFEFVGSEVDKGAHALGIYTAFFKVLDPACDAACKNAVKNDFNLPGDIANDPAFTAVQAAVVPGSLAADDSAVASGSAAAEAANGNSNNVESVGGPRNTNVGYYVLGAVLLAFIVGALIFFIVHKKPVAAQLAKEQTLRNDEVQLAPVVAAAPLHSGVVVQEEVPLAANQQQMDYRSVFALKHNVLDKSAEQKAAEEDEHNHNDVHFILHQ